MNGGDFFFGCLALAFGIGYAGARVGEGLMAFGDSLKEGMSDCWLTVAVNHLEPDASDQDPEP